jgi:hypothetical protein
MDNQRCQFYANHAPDLAHAFAWYVRHASVRRGRFGLTAHLIRWRDQCEPWAETVGESGLPWCGMFGE